MILKLQTFVMLETEESTSEIDSYYILQEESELSDRVIKGSRGKWSSRARW